MKSPFTRAVPHLASRVSLALVATGGGTHGMAAWTAMPAREAEAQGRRGFAYEGVLGTSMDVRLDATAKGDAQEAERRMLAELDRLEKILSARDPASELARVRAGASVASAELAEVLAAYDLWAARSGGALSQNLAEVIALWKQAEKDGREPDAAALAAAYARPGAVNIEALGKGYIVDRLAEVGRQFAPAGVVDIGGDLRVWGARAWMVGVADPSAPADNAAPLLHFPVRDAAVATSAGYARHYTINGCRLSHLIDPRSLRPLDASVSATVVARDCLTANAVAAAAAVLGADEGRSFARSYAMESLVMNAAGARPLAASLPTGGTTEAAALQPMAASSGGTSEVAQAWPQGFQVSLSVALKAPGGGGRYKRPYVAVWVENAEHKVVRTLAIWGDRDRYLPDLSHWWQATDGDEKIIRAVSRATRQPGTYTLAWNGRDERGTAVPKGDYTIWVEINREHGHHVIESVALKCETVPESSTLAATAESTATTAKYGPAEK